jgi:hypothetical protein
MKRLVILLCVFALMLDLSDDGHLGKGKGVTPKSPVQSLETSADLYSAAKSSCHHGLPSVEVQPFSPSAYAQPIKLVVQHPRKTMVSAHLSSAGGLPG